MRFDPKHLAALEVIHREGSLVGAARKLSTSQPALSRLLNELEARLGGPIFDRSLRPWQLTALGQVLSEQGSAVLRAQDRASVAIDAFRGGESGTIKIGGTPFFVDGVLSALMARFQRDDSKLRFDIRYGYSEDLLAALRRREIDLALCPFNSVESVPGVTFSPLLWVGNAISCRIGHPLTRLTIPRPLALLDYPWVVPPAGSPLAQDMRQVLAHLGMSDVRIALAGGSLASVLNYLQNSDALCVLPQSTIEHAAATFNVTSIDVDILTPRRQLGVLTNDQDAQPKVLQRFIDFLIVHLKSFAN
ncbi:MAG: LysR family transcriptional regulator [Pseudomonadota bacterium]